MRRVPVQSSNIRSVGFDSETLQLEIQFHHGGVYVYDGVPPTLHADLMTAASKGTLFHRRIKDRFPFQKK